MASKTECPVSREEFIKNAPPAITVMIGDTPVVAIRKEFSTGSFGYYATGKASVMVNGVPVPVQVGANITAIGSKPAETKPGKKK